MIEMLLKKLVDRLGILVNEKWTGQVMIEINMSQGSPGAVYFTAKEKMPVERKHKKGKEEY